MIDHPGILAGDLECIRAEVDAFHASALDAGARDNGASGLRPHYHAQYHGAFVIDPDGNKQRSRLPRRRMNEGSRCSIRS